MIEKILDLEKIKNDLSDVSLVKFFGYRNTYYWVELDPLDEKFEDIPLFDIPEEDYEKENIHVLERIKTPYIASCFGRFTYHFYKHSTRSRVLFTSIIRRDIPVNSSINNHCWMERDVLDYWIRTCKEEAGLNFFYKIEEFKEGDLNYKYYKITFDFIDLWLRQMRYILFWTRYAFEYPASLCALDAMLLKRDYFPEETLSNLLILTSTAQMCNPEIRINPSQCLPLKVKFLGEKVLKERVNERAEFVSGIYDKIDLDPYSIEPTCTRCSKENPNIYNPVRQWIDYTERFDQYKKLYDIFKSQEIS